MASRVGSCGWLESWTYLSRLWPHRVSNPRDKFRARKRPRASRFGCYCRCSRASRPQLSRIRSDLLLPRHATSGIV